MGHRSLRLHVPPDALKERHSGRWELGSLDLLRSDERFQKAHERLHTRLGFTSLIGDTDHQAQEMRKGFFVRHTLNQLIEKQPARRPSYLKHTPLMVSSLLKSRVERFEADGPFKEGVQDLEDFLLDHAGRRFRLLHSPFVESATTLSAHLTTRSNSPFPLVPATDTSIYK